MAGASPFAVIAVPGTRLRDCPPLPADSRYGNPNRKIGTWSGAALAGTRYIVGPVGGHGDYAGNEINSADCGADAPAWRQISERAPFEHCYNLASWFGPRESPSMAARHTYSGQGYCAPLNKIVVIGGGAMKGSAYPDPPADWPWMGHEWGGTFDLTTNSWDAPGSVLPPLPPMGWGETVGALFVIHPTTGEVVYSGNKSAGWYRWTPGETAWREVSARAPRTWNSVAAWDTKRDRILIVGGAAAEARSLDGALAAQVTGAVLPIDGWPGVVYDEGLDCFFVLANGGTKEAPGTIRMWRVDAQTLVAVEQPLAGILIPDRPTGIHNAVQYAPAIGGLLLAYAYDQDIAFIPTGEPT